MPDQLRYPIGPFVAPSTFTPELRESGIEAIAAAPSRLRDAVRGLGSEQLDTPYRSGGWTVRQVVHHVPDSHLNAYIRLKMALTEAVPTIKPYDEALWAQLPDTRIVPIDVSLSLLDALHERWVAILRGMGDEDFQRLYNHPETGQHSLDYMVQHYAWHGRHHTAHITELRKRAGW
jgi:uncharacterized damage-inducible protein DinB